MSVFFVGSWGMNRSAEQTNHPRTASRFTRFVCPALRFISHEPRKKDTHSLIELLQKVFKKFNGRYEDLIKQYEVPFSRILRLGQLQWLPNRSDFTQVIWFWYRTWPLLNYEMFSWIICNEYSMPARNAYPSGHLLSSKFWTCTRMFLLFRPCFHKLKWFVRLLHFENPSVLSRFCLRYNVLK